MGVNNKAPLISVIVPVYNVENYLRRCVDSIINQTYENLEIILVDDGSPDNCGIICDEYAKKDGRIKVIHRENGGLSAARNSALDEVKGEYITLIDSDDFVEKDYIEYMYKLLTENEADMSAVSNEMVFEGRGAQTNLNNSVTACFTQKETINELLNMTGTIEQMACGKLYKRNIFDDIRYPEGKLYEDLAVIFDIVLKINKVATSNAKLYKYYIREGSIIQTGFNHKQYSEVKIVDENMDMIEKIYPDLKAECAARRVYTYLKTVHRIMSSQGKEEFDQYIRELKKKIKHESKGLIFKKGINRNLKIKILAFKFGINVYETVQRISDERKQRQAGHRYIV